MTLKLPSGSIWYHTTCDKDFELKNDRTVLMWLSKDPKFLYYKRLWPILGHGQTKQKRTFQVRLLEPLTVQNDIPIGVWPVHIHSRFWKAFMDGPENGLLLRETDLVGKNDQHLIIKSDCKFSITEIDAPDATDLSDGLAMSVPIMQATLVIRQYYEVSKLVPTTCLRETFLEHVIFIYCLGKLASAYLKLALQGNVTFFRWILASIATKSVDQEWLKRAIYSELTSEPLPQVPSTCNDENGVYSIISYNVHGLCPATSPISPSRMLWYSIWGRQKLLEMISTPRHDIVCIQEMVFPLNEGWQKALLPCYDTVITAPMGRKFGIGFGNVVAVRNSAEVLNHAVIPLPASKQKVKTCRNAVFVQFRKFWLIATHLSDDQTDATDQLGAISTFIEKKGLGLRRGILLGDFNLEESEVRNKICDHINIQATKHAKFHTGPICWYGNVVDHACFFGGLPLVKAQNAYVNGSDHGLMSLRVSGK